MAGSPIPCADERTDHRQRSLTLGYGRAGLYPERAGRVRGFGKPEIDDVTWLIARVVHTVRSGNGFTTSIELETASAAGETETTAA